MDIVSRKLIEKFHPKFLENWKSGVTVSLVAMPLSISLAVASGTTPSVGIITAIWAGVVASLFGGSHFNVVGPTGALSGLIAAYAIVHGVDSLPMLTITTGVLILFAYLIKFERYLFFIPTSVIHGFTLGVAGIIAFNQLNFMLGIDGLPKHEDFILNVYETLKHITLFSPSSLLTFVVFLALMFILKKIYPKLPGALLLSPLGIILGYFAARGVVPLHLETLQSVFGNIHFYLFKTPKLSFDTSVYLPAVAVALVAVLETMLSAKIADYMTHTKHDERREMFGLGIANVFSGFAGGIPATAALARTSLNIKTGATNKLSAFIAAISLALISFFLLSYFSFIPMAVIAAILVFVSVQMIEREHFFKLYRFERSGFWMSILVALVTFFKDPVIGIMFGVGLSLFVFIEKISRGQFDIKLNILGEGIVKTISGEHADTITDKADILVYSFKGKLAYLNSHAHVKRFEQSLSMYSIVILRLRSVYIIDIDGAAALDEIIAFIRSSGRRVCLTSLNPNVTSLLDKVSDEYRQLKNEGLIFVKSTDALRYFGIDPNKENIL